MDAAQGRRAQGRHWLSEAIGRPVRTPEQVYAEQRAESLARAATALGIAGNIVVSIAVGEEPAGLPVPGGTR